MSHRSPGSIPFTRNFFVSRWSAARKSLATCAAVFSVYKRFTRTQVLRRRASCKVLTQNDRRIHAWSGGKSSVSAEDSRSSSGFEPMSPSAAAEITTCAVCPMGVSEFAQPDLISHTIFPYCLQGRENLVIALTAQMAAHVSNNYLPQFIVKKDVDSVHTGALSVANMGKCKLGATLPGKCII